jgi:lipopolysaccharide biosynthesis regulator YciM
MQNFLELACAYANAGFYGEAEKMLVQYSSGKQEAALNPMVNYLRGYFLELQGDTVAAAKYYAAGSRGPAIYTNPHRLEEKSALEAALRNNPNDSRAHLYLGNLSYAIGQRAEGLAHWKKAVQLDERLSLAWRNVGLGELQLNKNAKEAYTAYQTVMKLDPRDGRALLELSQVAEGLKISLPAQLLYLEKYPEAVNSRDDLTAKMLDLRLENGSEANLRKVESVLTTRHFHSWEGGYGIHESWVEVYQKLGDLAFARKDYPAALDYYKKCFDYPKNLEVAPRSPNFQAHNLWNLVKVYQAMNNPATARKHMDEILAEKYGRSHLGTYYQALAQKELNNTGAYQALLGALEKQAREYNSGIFENRRRQVGVGHYLLSLVLAEKGDKENATVELNTALSQNSMVRRAAVLQAQLDVARAHQ